MQPAGRPESGPELAGNGLAATLATGALLAAHQGNREAFEQAARACLGALDPAATDMQLLPTVGWLAQACWLMDQRPPAVVSDILQPLAGTHIIVGLTSIASLGPVDRHLAQIASHTDPLETVVTRFEACAALCHGQGQVLHEAATLNDLATLLERADDQRAAGVRRREQTVRARFVLR